MKIAFVFSGQGTQYIGMCRDLYLKEEVVRNIFDRASNVLGYNLLDICQNDAEKLNRTSVAQPAIFTASVAMARMFEVKNEIVPVIAAGNSIGEYAALVSAKVLSFENALMLVKKRAEFMEEAAEKHSGVMYDVKGYSLEKAETVINEKKGDNICCISNINGKNNFVISGNSDIVECVIDQMTSEGAKTIKLNVSSGFHSPLMYEAAKKFDDELQKYSFCEPTYPIISNITGKVYRDAVEIKSSLGKQITHTVRWDDSMHCIEDYGCTDVIEFGPKKTLKNLINNNTSMDAYSYDIPTDRELIDEKYDINITRATVFGGFLKAAVITKNNNDDYSEYSDVVIKNYKAIEKIYIMMAGENYIPSKQELEECGNRLLHILQYKKVEDSSSICQKLVSDISKRLFR